MTKTTEPSVANTGRYLLRLSAGMRLFLLPFALYAPESYAQTVFFPIGIFGATCNVGTPYTPATATTLDKIRGTPALGYASGFNVVQSYWHKSTYDHVTNAGVFVFLNHAESLGLKVLVTIPGGYDSLPDWQFTAPGDKFQGRTIPAPGEGPHLFQRTPPDYSEALSVARATKAHPSVYGYYIADEPTDVYSVRSFYNKAVSAQNLAKALTVLKSQADSGHPYLIALADYDENPGIWGRSHTNAMSWRWNDSGAVTVTEPTFGGRLQTELNYDRSADIILNDTFVIDNDAAWVVRLHKFDDMISTKGRNIHAVIACVKNSRGLRNDYRQLRLQVYTAIIHGVAGIWFYSYSDTFDGKVSFDAPSQYFVSTLVPLSNELAAVRHELEGVTVGQYFWGRGRGDFADVNSPGVQYILKLNGTESLLIAANASSSNVSAEVDLSTLPSVPLTKSFRGANEARILFETGRSSIRITSGVLVDRFAPWEVHVYRFAQQ
jgi:hypothetical protein